MKTQGKQSLMRRAAITILSVMLIVGMMPFYTLTLFGKDSGNAYAAMPSDGTGWTASGANGLKYFQNIYGTGTQVTSLSYGQTLYSGVYYIMNNITLRPQYPDSYKRTSALKISGHVKLIFLNNSSLTVQGGRALGYGEEYWRGSSKYTNWDSDMGGAGAGIELSSGNTLTVDGSGYIYATGGRAGNGQTGERPDGGNDEDSNSRGYHGGYGGRGGGGAGAGIGTKGGYGSTSQGSRGWGDAGDGSASASGGGNGGDGGSSSSSGTFIQYGNVRVSATGGDGGRGGDRGTSRWESQSYRDAHGGGGGGGGAGLPANAIGSGGPGGGAGGGGGGGAVKRDNNGSCAGGSGGGGGGGWDGSQVARGGERGAYDTEKGKTNAYGKDGKDASWDFDGSTFSGGNGGKRSTASSARAGKGGKGGSSGSYGNSGTIVGTNTGDGQQYRIYVDGYTAGGRYSTYCVVPKREITITITENTAGNAKLNPDGKSYLYVPNKAVEPKVVIKHIPTGATLTEDTYNTSVDPRQSNQNYNYYTVYSNNKGAPPSPNPREASVRVLANSRYADQWQRRIVNNDVNGNVPGGAGTLKDIDYKIDYETYKVTLDAAGGIGTRTVDVKLGNTNGTWGPGFNGNPIDAPTREGFVFDGFWTGKNGSGTQYFKSNNGAEPIRQWTTKGNGTLYAKWIPLTYKIRFWSDYGNGSEYVEYNLSDFVYEKPSQPETSAKLKPATYGNLVLPSAHDLGISRDHYDFVGWNIYEEQDWAMYKAGKTYKAGLTTKQDDIVNIYAAWRAKDQLVVSYDANGGSGAPPVDGTWADADYKISTQVPVREGYTFKGWNSAASPEYEDGVQTNGFAYTKGETVKASDTKAIKASTTLYAQWERNPSVSYRANGGSLETAIPTKYPAKGSTVTIDYGAITRTGYEFVGWHVKGSSNHKVYVENAPAQSKITVDGTEYNLTQATTFEMPAESVVLEALWTPEKMDIDFVTDSKGGEKGLYDLDGWYYADSEGERLPETETAGIKSVNSMEIEYDKPLSFQVVVDRNKVDDSAFRLRINDINTAPADVKVNDETNIATYKFAVAKVRAGQMIQTAGLVGKTFPVILDANEGELRGTVTSHTFGEATALPTRADSEDADGNTPVKKGFAFDGWYDAETEDEVSGNKVESISAETIATSEDGTFTFHAKWIASKYNLAYNIGPFPGEDGSVLQWKDGVNESEYKADVDNNAAYKNIPYSEEVTLPALSDYVKYEYGALDEQGQIQQVEAQFLGWATKKSATEPEFSSGQTVRRLTDKDEATVTLYPVWGAPRYKLVLDPNGGKLTEPITGYQAGDTIDLTEVKPVRAGYDFGGWFGEKIEDDADVSEKTPVTSIPAREFGDKTYYAYWTAKTYKFTLKGINLETGEDTGETWESGSLKVGDTAILNLPDAIATPEGKALAGWTERYNPVTREIPSASEDEDPTIEIIGYIPGAVLFTAGEETADLWTVNDEGNFVGRTLYPVWKNADDETLIYDANGGQEAPDMVEEPRGTAVDVDFENAPKRQGYVFAGYDTDKTTAYDDSENLDYPAGTPATITLDTSKRLYAIWEPVAYDITFDAAVADSEENVGFDDGSGNWSKKMTQTVAEYDEEVALSSKTPSRGSMYEFLGWSTVKNGQVEYQPGSIVSQFADVNGSELTGKTLYAIWLTKDPAYLSFDAMGGIGAPSMETHPQGTEVSVKADDENRAKPTYHGYTFKGWGTSSEDPDGTKVDKVNMPNEVKNITLYAIWEQNQSIRLVYDSGSGATGSVPTDPTSYYEGETASVLYRPAPSKTGYKFLGWNVVDKNGETVRELRKDDEDDMSLEITQELIETADQGQLILEAAFKANEYTVSFDGNGAKSGDAPAAITKTYDDGDVEMPKYGGEGADVEEGDGSLVAPTGFTFAGWNTEKDGSGTMLEAGRVNWELSTAANDEVTLYAIWTAAATNVVFDNGDSDNYPMSFEYGQVLPDNLEAPKKTGYDFKYYYIEEYSHNADGDYLNAAGAVVQTQEEAEVLKTKYYDDSMEPLKKWEMTAEDLRFQVGGGDTFNMKAEWEAQTYMISYHDDKGVLVSSQEITYGKDFRVADASDLEVPSGYRHVGWKFKNDPEQLTPDIQADKGITPTKANGLYNNGQTVSVYAVFQEIRKFKVNYDANGGTDAPQDTKQYEPGERATVFFEPIPKRANYDFLGWTTYSNTSSVLPGGAQAGKYYGDATIPGVETIDGYTYHYGEAGGSNTQKELEIEMRNDVKFYAVWVPKTYYTVDFYGNSTSNGGAADKVTVKGNKFTGPDNRSYTKSASNDGFRTDEAIFRSTSPYKGDKSTKIKLPDGSLMFNNTNDGAKFMGWSKSTDAKLADHVAGEDLEDITMDENVVLSAVWAYPVRNVTLKDIEKPVYENAPSEDIEATAASGVTVTKSTWSPSTEQFATGTKYKLTVKMKVADGYYFDSENLPTVKMDVDGIDGLVDATASLNAEGNVLTATYTFDATENIIINGDKDKNKAKPIAFTGVAVPEAGKTLGDAGNVVDSRIDNDSWSPAVTWTACDAQGQPKDVKGIAEPDTIYTATVRLTAAKGYEFNADVTRVTFNGKEVDTVVDPETKELVITYVFPKTAEIDNDINLKLSGSLKNGDSLPDQTFTSANDVDKDSRLATIDWFKVDGGNLTEISSKDKVAPSTKYVAQVELKPADGYSFTAEQTTVTFGGDKMLVVPANEETDGNNWAKLTENGTILVSHEFDSSADTLIEIYDPASLSAEYGTKVSDVEDLPREVQIHTENGKRNTDVTWIDEDGKVAVVSEEGTIKLTDAEALNQKREAHTVKIVGTVTIPDGVTLPDEMTATATLTVKVAADPDLDSIELNLEGIKKSGGTLNYNSTFPNKVHTEDVTVDYQDRHQEPDWLTEDTNVISGQNYIAEVTLSPTEGHKFSTRRNVIFDGVVIPITEEKPEKTDENEAEYAYAVLNDDGSITVGRTYQSKNANMTKADELQAVEVAWDAPKTPEGLGLPTTDGIDIDDRNRNSGRETATIASADWNLDNYISKDLNKRKAHEVTVSAVLTMPDGVNDPETETKTVTVTVKVAADPRLVPEAEAAQLESTARTAMENVTEESSPRAQRLKTALEESIGDMNEYIADLENSTVKGIEDEITKVRKALAELEEETVMSVSLESEIKIDEELPANAHSEHDRVDADSRDASITWSDTTDGIAKEDTTYWASFEFKPADGKQFYEGSFVKFEDDVVITTGEQFDAENPKNSAWVDSETGNLKVVRSYKTPKLNLASIDAPAALNAKFGDDIATVGLAETVNAKTNAGDRALTVNWNTEDINLGDVSSPEVRKAHDVKVSGVAVLPDSITNDDNVSLEVFTTIHVAADPRLEKEAAAAKLDEEAKEIINKAKNAGAGANEIAELEEALQAMRDEVSEDNLDKSTPESDQEKIDAVNTDLNALKKAISDKEEADRRAAEEADRKRVAAGHKTILTAKGIASGPTAIDISWGNVSADRYLVYFAKCNAKGTSYPCKIVKTTNGKTFKFRKNKLAKNTSYKFYVVAQKKSGNGYKTIAKSLDGHVFTGNVCGKYTNPSKLTIKPARLTLKVGKSATIKGTVSKAKSGKALGTTHAKTLRFASNNPVIATVNASGKVTAKHKGSCKVFVQTINGIWQVCTVTVK